MRFLVDAQLPPALADWLGTRGYSATAVRNAGLRDSDDGSIRYFLIRGHWVLITKDDDFVERSMMEAKGPSIVWLRIGNCTNRVLFAWLAPLGKMLSYNSTKDNASSKCVENARLDEANAADKSITSVAVNSIRST